MQNAEKTDRNFNVNIKGTSGSNERCRRRLLKGGEVFSICLGDAARRSACCKLQGDGMTLVTSSGHVVSLVDGFISDQCGPLPLANDWTKQSIPFRKLPRHQLVIFQFRLSCLVARGRTARRRTVRGSQTIDTWIPARADIDTAAASRN